jgi:hypothetical protein
MKLVVNAARSGYDVLIGRPSKWGNIYSHRTDTKAKFLVSTRQEAIEKYEVWLRAQPHLIAELHTLRDKVLGCWCRPETCHGDVLLKLIDELCVSCDKRLREDVGDGARCAICLEDAR